MNETIVGVNIDKMRALFFCWRGLEMFSPLDCDNWKKLMIDNLSDTITSMYFSLRLLTRGSMIFSNDSQ